MNKTSTPPLPEQEEKNAEKNAEIPQSNVDRLLRANMARMTFGISPIALGLAYTDWAEHLASSPGKAMRLVEKMAEKNSEFQNYLSQSLNNPAQQHCIEPLPQDDRFKEDAWNKWPFNNWSDI